MPRKGRQRRTLGRPELPTAKRRSERVVTYLTPADFERLEEWASADGTPVAELVRQLVERALARRQK